ncbi:hypothetical protein V1286_004171 [Bradyrhizobium algeriense]|uniref:Cytochrome P450 n=1 Tax=Bradyrhizobium algeriense TaxID=634784 RepID=A0ABU8BEU2_9BRAD
MLISHLFFLPIKEMPSDREKEARNQASFWEISPLFLDYPINFYFNAGGVFWFHTRPKFLGTFERRAAPEPERFMKFRSGGAVRKWGGLRPIRK